MSIFSKYPNSSFLKALKEERPSLFDIPRRQRIEDLFSYLDGLEDIGFESKLDDDPESMIWEMVVAKLIKTSGLDPVRPKTEAGGPDFIFNHNNRRVVVEAYCPGIGSAGLPNSVSVSLPNNGAISDAQYLFRICNWSGTESKREKFKEWRANGIIRPDDVCIIAISSMKLGDFARDPYQCLAVQATLGVGPIVLVLDAKTRQSQLGQSYRGEILKATGKPVNTAVFLEESYSDIAGMIYSEANPNSLDFSLERETSVIHNPMAQYPLGYGAFSNLTEYWTVLSTSKNCWTTYQLGTSCYDRAQRSRDTKVQST